MWERSSRRAGASPARTRRSSARLRPTDASAQARRGTPPQQVPPWLTWVANNQPSVKPRLRKEVVANLPGEPDASALRLIDVESNQPRGLALGSKQPPNGPETVQTPRETNKPSSEQTPLQQSQRCQF